jgi:hypothetical protein
MLSIDEYTEALRSRDPEMAFVSLETQYRAALDKKLENSDNNYFYNACVIEYMNHTLAAARALELQFLDGWEIPAHRTQVSLSDRLRDFTTAVDHFKVQVQIAHARGTIQYSVALDPEDKTKIRHFVQQIKDVIDKAPLPTPKKERLFDKINAFLAEVDRDRTGWQAFSDLVIAVAHLGGDAARELEPARKLIDSISRLLGRAKEFEDSAPQISSKPTPRQIPAPRKGLPPPNPEADTDGEIPF